MRQLRELTFQQSLTSVIMSLVSAIMLIPILISFAALIFSGPLDAHLPMGIGLLLFGGLVMTLVMAVGSSFPNSIMLPQDSPAAVLAVMAASIVVAYEGGSGEEVLFTVLAVITLSTLLVGIAFLLLGTFKIGNLVRFMPYPVVGGFLAGMGWMLVLGGLKVSANSNLNLLEWRSIFAGDLVLRWLPALLFAVLMMVLLRRFDQFWITPSLLVGAAVLFYVVLLGLAGLSLPEASAGGWFLGPFPGGGLWRPLAVPALLGANWQLVLRESGNMGTILILSTVSALLNIVGLEIAANQDIDLNRELQSAGLANLLAGLGGSVAGYPSLSLSALNHKLKANGRLVNLLLTLILGVVLLLGASLLSFFPRPLAGSLLIFMGLSFMTEWIYDGFSTLPRSDYAVVWLILAVIAGVGFLEGVGVGLAVTIVLFVVNYSRIQVIKHQLDAASYQSKVERPRLYRQLIHAKANWINILELQGFLFFGNANTLLNEAQERVNSPDTISPRYIVLDFRQVSGIDHSALVSFIKLRQFAEAHDIVLVFTNMPPLVQRQLANGVLDDDNQHVKSFADLDHGVEWCEDRMIEVFESTGLAATPQTTMQQLQSHLPPGLSMDSLLTYFEKAEVEAGEILIRQGSGTDGIKFIEKGAITVFLDTGQGESMRLYTSSGGTIVGEMSNYLNKPAGATVIADTACEVYTLCPDKLEAMQAEDPEIAAVFHSFIAQMLAERVSAANRSISALSS